MLAQRVEHLFVFLGRVLPLRAIVVGVKAHRMGPGVDAAVGLAEHRVLGGGVDGRVDARIELVVACQVLAREAGHHFVMQGPDLIELGIGDALGREFARQAFERGQHFEGVEDVIFLEAGGHGAAVGQQLHQAFDRQQLDGFAQGGARDAQQRAQLALVEFGAGGDLALHQHAAQPFGHLFMQRDAWNFSGLNRRYFVDHKNEFIFDGLIMNCRCKRSCNFAF
ncbi:hypothetical protein D3C78_1146920 [compost metagenome]